MFLFNFCRSFVMSLYRICRSFVISLFRYVALLNLSIFRSVALLNRSLESSWEPSLVVFHSVFEDFHIFIPTKTTLNQAYQSKSNEARCFHYMHQLLISVCRGVKSVSVPCPLNRAPTLLNCFHKRKTVLVN